METQLNLTVSSPSSNGSTDDVFSDVPLFAVYLKILLLMIVIPAVVISASLIIHVIWKNKSLHTKYYFFVVNLLINDIASTPRFLYEIVLMSLYLFGVTVDHTDIFYMITTIPRINLRFAFLLLAVDRIIGVTFPYRHRKIMTSRVVYTLIVSAWLMAAATTFIVRWTSTVLFIPPFANFIPSSSPVGSIIIFMTLLVSVILIVVSNAYLFYITTQSNKRLQQNRNLSGADGNEVSKVQRLLRTLKMQAKPTASALILGGIDCAMIVLTIIILAVINASSSEVTKMYIFQMVYLIESGQMLSHFFVYGIYMKEIRHCIQKYELYQRLRRRLHLHFNQVAPQ